LSASSSPKTQHPAQPSGRKLSNIKLRKNSKLFIRVFNIASFETNFLHFYSI
jgi:hypothetical protein